MNLVTGAARVIVTMQHVTKGEPKIVPRCTLPLTAVRRVVLVITELAVIAPTPSGLVLQERAPGVEVDQIRAATAAHLIIPDDVSQMVLA